MGTVRRWERPQGLDMAFGSYELRGLNASGWNGNQGGSSGLFEAKDRERVLHDRTRSADRSC